MTGHLLLAGGAEFGGAMAAPDRRAIELAGGPTVPICIIPTAAAPDNNHNRAGSNGKRWFESLGATNVSVVPIIDDASANDSALANQLAAAKLIYLLGGFPHYLAQTLQDSRCWDAVIQAYQNGAVLGGSSAGAMVLCEHYFNPSEGQLVAGLNLVPQACVLPHYNTFGKDWVDRLQTLLPEAILIGIDEFTGMIDDQPNGGWSIHGQGGVTLYQAGQVRQMKRGDTL